MENISRIPRKILEAWSSIRVAFPCMDQTRRKVKKYMFGNINNNDSGPSLWQQTMDKLGANFRGIEGKMQSLLKKDEKETNSETSSLKFENNKRNDQIVQVNNQQQQSAPSENMNQNYDLEEEYRNLRPQRYFLHARKILLQFFLVAEDLVARGKSHVIVQGNHVKRDYLEV